MSFKKVHKVNPGGETPPRMPDGAAALVDPDGKLYTEGRNGELVDQNPEPVELDTTIGTMPGAWNNTVKTVIVNGRVFFSGYIDGTGAVTQDSTMVTVAEEHRPTVDQVIQVALSKNQNHPEVFLCLLRTNGEVTYRDITPKALSAAGEKFLFSTIQYQK